MKVPMSCLVAMMVAFTAPLTLNALKLSPEPKVNSKKAKASDQVTGVMKQIVDDYVSKYNEEETEWKTKSESMQKVIDKMIDKEGKESAIDEKLKMKEAHEKKLEEYA